MRTLNFFFGGCLFAACATAMAQPHFQFRFGSGPAEPGWILVSPTNVYSARTGYGFEPGATVRGTDYLTSDQPFLFSAMLPEGNYGVTVFLSGKISDSMTTVKAEQRRLVLEQVHPAAGAARTFIVNIRTPRISDTEKVRLKPRELDAETVEWDDKLTLEFNGLHPTVRALLICPTNVPTVFIAGDSTVCDQPAEPWSSWGQMLPRFFKPDVAVANYAESGETVASSLAAHRFDKIFSLMKSGDYLLVQFGHNDMKDKATNSLAAYKAKLKELVERTRRLGGTPILVTSMERKTGVQQDTLMGYPQAVRDVSQEANCALIDLHAMSKTLYKALGPDLDKAFVDGTHHNNYGSYELARCIIEGIKQTRLPLARSILDDVGRFNPANPDSVVDFQMAASPLYSVAKPQGN
jgi:lysophospholipase L1-like esterase